MIAAETSAWYCTLRVRLPGVSRLLSCNIPLSQIRGAEVSGLLKYSRRSASIERPFDLQQPLIFAASRRDHSTYLFGVLKTLQNKKAAVLDCGWRWTHEDSEVKSSEFCGTRIFASTKSQLCSPSWHNFVHLHALAHARARAYASAYTYAYIHAHC